MINYNSKDWIRLIFIVYKSDTLKVLLPAFITLIIYSFGIVYLEIEIIHTVKKNYIVIHTLLGFVLSMLLVFRINSAYDRWWEGRKLWGALVNTSRNLSFKVNSMLKPEQQKLFLDLICNYPEALKNHLRDSQDTTGFKFNDLYDSNYYSLHNHKPNAVSKALYEQLNFSVIKNNISNEQMIILNDDIKQYADICGACERIKNTPIPFSYSLYLKKIIFLFVFSMPIGFATEFGYWTIPIVMLVFYTFTSLEIIAEEIEDPFGTDSNDLPTDEITNKIISSVQEIIKPH